MIEPARPVSKRSLLVAVMRQAFWAPGLVLVFWAVAAKGFNAYIRYPDLDMPTHFFGGLASAYFFETCIIKLGELYGQIHAYFRLALSLSMVGVMAVLWEFSEFLSDKFNGSHLNLGVSDTLSDLFFGLLGACCFVAIRLVRSRR
jgi:hypothetical protein